MGRHATGSIVEHDGKDGRVYRALRFRAYGERQYIALGPVSREAAERELRGVLADVERGLWQPDEPAPAPEPVARQMTLHELAEQWWVEREGELRPKTRRDYRWRLEWHLIPFFGQHELWQITIAEVDRFKAAKLAEGRLSARSINMCLTLLAAILEVAEERELIDRNPAKGKRRRVRERRPRRSYLDTAAQITTLLDAAASLDAEARHDRRSTNRHALLSVLVFAGLRIGELCELRWRDVDLAAGRLRVDEAKTDAGQRDVKLRPVLRDVLAALKAGATDRGAEALVFPTSRGRALSQSNVRSRILAKAVERANKGLAEDDDPPLPDGLTPHSLRRTFASMLYALGESPAVVMAEMGHTDPALALRIYAQAMRRDPGENDRLRALVEGETVGSALPVEVEQAQELRHDDVRHRVATLEIEVLDDADAVTPE
jgi:integrase